MPQNSSPVSSPEAKSNPVLLRPALWDVDLKKARDAFDQEVKGDNFSVQRQEILTQLNNLLTTEDVPAQITQVENLRKYLLKEVMAKETEESRAFCDQVFKLQILLAANWPSNDIDDDGEPLEPIVQTEIILPTERVASSQGQVFDRNILETCLKKNSGYKNITSINARVKKSPPTRDTLSNDPCSELILVQENPGQPISSAYLVDRLETPPRISRIEFSENKPISAFAKIIYPSVLANDYSCELEVNHDDPIEERAKVLNENEKKKIKLNLKQLEDLGGISGFQYFIKTKNPLGGYFTLRELMHFKASKVKLSDYSLKAFQRINDAHGRGLAGENIDDESIDRRVERERQNLDKLRFILTSICFYLLAGFTSPLNFLILCAASLYAAFIEDRRPNGSRFAGGLFTVFFGGAALLLALSMGPSVLPLFFKSPGAATAAYLIKSWPAIEAGTLAFISLGAALGEYFKPGLMTSTFGKMGAIIASSIMVVPLITLTLVFGLLKKCGFLDGVPDGGAALAAVNRIQGFNSGQINNAVFEGMSPEDRAAVQALMAEDLENVPDQAPLPPGIQPLQPGANIALYQSDSEDGLEPGRAESPINGF